MNAIEVKGLHKRFKSIEALKGISFDVKEGEIFGLLGPNGAGKSTTINILTGLLEKDAGSIRILGKDPSEVREQMNVTSAYTWLPSRMTVYQNLKVYGKLYGVMDLDKRINELLALFKITSLRDKHYGSLSTGQRERVMICKGLVNNPKVLLLDEATVGLDPDIAQHTRQVIKDISSHTSILFTSHNMHEVEALCDRIAILHKGRIITLSTPHQIKRIMKKKTLEEVFIQIAREADEVV